MTNKETESAEEDKVEQVDEPNDVDVLMGRGGMSNHHAGNEWYRRLIRSNRPLYRACPKHTKLLVAKAIVQAVEQQGGRFLDRCKTTGNWHTVPYKRAVDKTSQGLREKDRDNKDGNSNSNNNSSVPIQFSGKNKLGSKGGPNLADLADVAIAHANRAMEPPLSQPKRGAAVNKTAARRTQKQQAAAAKANGNNDSNNNNNSGSKKRSHEKQSQPAPMGILRGGSSYHSSEYNASSSSSQQQQQPHNKRARMAPNTTSFALDDVEPLPPTTQLAMRQSSMFRLLKHTKLMPGVSSGPVDPPYGMQHQQQHQQSYGMGGGDPPTLTRLKSQVSDWLQSFWPLNKNEIIGRNNMMDSQNNNTSGRNSGSKNYTQQQAETASPPSRMAAVMQAQAVAASIPPPGSSRQKSAEQIEKDIEKQRKTLLERHSNTLKSGLEMRLSLVGAPLADAVQQVPSGTNIPLAPSPQNSFLRNTNNSYRPNTVTPNHTMSQSSVHPGMAVSSEQESDAATAEFNGEESYGSTASNPAVTSSSIAGSTALPPPSSTRNKRKSRSSLPALPYGAPSSSEDDNTVTQQSNANGKSTAPTELEQSVSASLLSLATTPSTLFSGLTTLFDRTDTATSLGLPGSSLAAGRGLVGSAVSQSITGGNRAGSLIGNNNSSKTNSNADSITSGAQSPSATRRESKSRNSLLDDYDESPMEARLRAVPWGAQQ